MASPGPLTSVWLLGKQGKFWIYSIASFLLGHPLRFLFNSINHISQATPWMCLPSMESSPHQGHWSTCGTRAILISCNLQSYLHFCHCGINIIFEFPDCPPSHLEFSNTPTITAKMIYLCNLMQTPTPIILIFPVHYFTMELTPNLCCFSSYSTLSIHSRGS